jgi:hypothetical protein
MSAEELALTILPKFNKSILAKTDTYFGSAQVFKNGQFGHYACVFYDQVQDPANRGPASVSQILGHIAAHELGHLLLRSSAHAASGLMRAQWHLDDLQRATSGRLLFSPTEAKRIRSEVLVRSQYLKRTSLN